MPEDLPVTKCINVMVGITRSKVIGPYSVTLLKPGNFRHPPCAGYVPFCTSVLRNRLLCSRSSTSTCQHETKACQMVQEGVPVSTRLFVRLVVWLWNRNELIETMWNMWNYSADFFGCELPGSSWSWARWVVFHGLVFDLLFTSVTNLRWLYLYIYHFSSCTVWETCAPSAEDALSSYWGIYVSRWVSSKRPESELTTFHYHGSGMCLWRRQWRNAKGNTGVCFDLVAFEIDSFDPNVTSNVQRTQPWWGRKNHRWFSKSWILFRVNRTKKDGFFLNKSINSWKAARKHKLHQRQKRRTNILARCQKDRRVLWKKWRQADPSPR
jgi:hypothetical protein